MQGAQNKLAVYNHRVEETQMQILITAGDKHGIAMARNHLKMLREKIKYR